MTVFVWESLEKNFPLRPQSTTSLDVLTKNDFRKISNQPIQCNENLVVIEKYDGAFSCVATSTQTLLIKRSWTDNQNTGVS